MKGELGLHECDGLMTCDCGARIYGDSLNDAAIAWVKHVVEKHPEELE
jgi:hypothetical protein